MKIISFVLLVFLCLPKLMAEEVMSEKATMEYARIAYSPIQNIAERLLKLVYERAGVDMVITQLPAKRASFEAKTGQKDGEILRIESYGDNKKSLYRIPYPLGYVKTRIYVHKDYQFVEIEDMRNYKVGVVKGIKHANDYVKGYPYIYYFSDVNAMMKQLDRGKVDIAISNEVNARFELAKLKRNNILELDHTVKIQGAYHYINVKHLETIRKVEHVVEQMAESGELGELWNQYAEELIKSN